MGEAPGRARAGAQEGKDGGSWGGSYTEGSDPPSSDLLCHLRGSSRWSYSHFVRQPRVGRQRDLKGNLRPEEESERELGQAVGRRIGEGCGQTLTWWSR